MMIGQHSLAKMKYIYEIFRKQFLRPKGSLFYMGETETASYEFKLGMMME